MKGNPIIKIVLLSFGCVIKHIVFVQPVLAVQSHGGTEGLVAHEIGHILFILGMGYLLFRIHRNRITAKGWVEFKIFLWLIIGWNILTFSGHWLDEFIASEKYIKISGKIHSFSINGLSDIYFYLTRLDHILLVPSFIFLLIALQKWRHE